MFKICTHKTFLLLPILLILALLLITKGCKKDRSPSGLPDTRPQNMKLIFDENSALQAKVEGLTVRFLAIRIAAVQ